MPSKRGKQQTYGRIKPTDIIINEPQRYDCPEGHAHIYILGKRYRNPSLFRLWVAYIAYQRTTR